MTSETNNTSFRKKILNSAKFSSLGFLSEVLLRLGSTVILTRLLSPDIYGVFAIVIVYMYMLEMFSDLGLRSLVVTKEDPVEADFLRTCWTVSILRGVVILLLSIGLAFVIFTLRRNGIFANDSAYSATELPWVLIAIGAVNFLRGFSSPHVFMAERGMLFGRVTLVQISANFLSLVVTVAFAFYLRSIWALVYGAAIKVMFEVGLSFIAFPGATMRLSLKRKNLRLIYNRGKWIMSHSALTAVSQSADRLFLGFVMTASTFGFYVIARQIIDLFMRLLISMNAQMGLQIFTRILKDEASVFRQKYYLYRLVFDAISGVCTGGILIVAPALVQIVFDDRYQSVAPLLQILSLGLLVLGPMILRDAFSAQRQFKEMTILSIVTAITIWAGLGISVLIFDSITAALICIALFKLPETIILWIKGYYRGWVVPIRELTPLVFVPIGMALGWMVLRLQDYVL